MNRLQTKCVLASASAHLVLVLTVLVGSAFFVPKLRTGATVQVTQNGGPPIQVVQLPMPPDALLAPAPAPSVADSRPVSVPAPVRVVEPRPTNPRLDPLGIDTTKPSRTPRVSTNLVARLTGAPPVSTTTSGSSGFNAPPTGTRLDGLLRALSSGTPIEISVGDDRDLGHEDYAQRVKEIYDRTWNPPASGIAREDGTTTAAVVIASDGRVLSAQITTSSDDSTLDTSVQRALAQVKSVEPFEAGAKERQRTYTIHFNLKARRALQ
jgi:TonB family protein